MIRGKGARLGQRSGGKGRWRRGGCGSETVTGKYRHEEKRHGRKGSDNNNEGSEGRCQSSRGGDLYEIKAVSLLFLILKYHT